MALNQRIISKLMIGTLLCILPHLLYAQTPEENYRESIKKMNVEKYEDAFDLIDRSIKQEKDSAKYFFQRALVEIWLKKPQDFYRDIDQAVFMNGNYAEAYLLRGDMLKLAGEYFDAIKDYNMVITVAKQDSMRYSGYIGRGNCKWKMRSFDGALADYKIAAGIDSLKPGAYHGMGNTLFDLGKIDEAMNMLLKAYAMDTSNIGILESVCYEYGMIGEYDLSIKYCDLILEKHPKSARAFNNRGYAKMKKGDLGGALDDINASLKIFPGNSYAFRNRALVYIEQKKFKKVCEDLQKSLDLNFTLNYGDEVKKLQQQYCN
jgi:tetratricopeptide (TPR) repeat protein